MDQIEQIEQWPDSRKLLLYTIGLLEDMRKDGLIEGGPPLTEKGREGLQRLVTSGFTATNDEIQRTIDFLVQCTGLKRCGSTSVH